MASILDSVGKLVHGAATSLIDNQVPDKLADVIGTAVKSGFDVITDSLKVIQDITKPAETPPNGNGS
ncbi:MAG TPA: hypothetical protein VHA10_25300 [Hypericibacter adhaerens]|jgi:hypothetical protein|uniref:Uncharacterized protein n=1 Tax=Hypericibacter adhaerens TaxID=2602016 RepID=A0A5J6N0I1_9PROT|nr:hypothetical protein [Hypericibacter adhaerens]QEX20386.1 hypothetical protein FRZ61_03030 [Hypericibacter adhaerens]HWA46560.1 hypothetical protein [Hypericibacter adhaerens]